VVHWKRIARRADESDSGEDENGDEDESVQEVEVVGSEGADEIYSSDDDDDDNEVAEVVVVEESESEL